MADVPHPSPAHEATHDPIKVRCLPIAGDANPYQLLMMQGIAAHPRLDVEHGPPGKFLVTLRTWLRDRPDVIHYDWNYRYFIRRHIALTYISSALFLLEVWLVRYVLGCQITWTLHNIQAHESYTEGLEQWVQRRFARMCRWIRVFSDVTVPRAAEYLDIDPGVFRVVPNGAYVDYYPNEITRQDAREQLNIATDQRVLLYFGVIRPYKGITELVRTFQQLQPAGWALLIVGAPRHEAYVEEIAALAEATPTVRFMPDWVPMDRLQVYFNACDCVVLPFSLVENSASTIVTMGFGCPVLVPRQGVLEEILSHQATLLYEPGDLEQGLSTAVGLSADELAALGAANLEAAQQYQWTAYADHFIDLFDEPTSS